MLRRALRHVVTVLSALSLLLCVAACVVWVRSYYRADTLYLLETDVADPSHRHINIGSRVGGIYYYEEMYFYRGLPNLIPTREYGLHTESYAEYPGREWIGAVRLGGFVWASNDRPVTPSNGRYVAYRGKSHGVVVPAWAFMLTLALLPSLWVARRVGRRRAALALRAGFCPGCGYDLRASPEQCPECGTVVKTRA